MSLSNVASLIPDRDSDSSDDEFLDALERVETEPEVELVIHAPELPDDNTVNNRSSVASKGSIEVDSGPFVTSPPLTVTSSGTSVTSSNGGSGTSTPSSQRHSTPHSPTSLPPGSELTISREMPPKFDLALTVESDSLSTPSQNNTPYRTPEFTPLGDSKNESFASCRTTVPSPNGDQLYEEDEDCTTEVSDQTVIPVEPPPRPPPPQTVQTHATEPEDEALAMMTIKCLDTGESTTMDKMEELLKDADPLSKHLTAMYGYHATTDSDSDTSSFQGSRATIATFDENDDMGTGTKSSHKNRIKMKSFAKKMGKGMGKGMSKSVKNLSKNMRVTKKENESAAEWEVQSGDITVYPNLTYKHYKHDTEKFNVIELQSIKKAHVKAIWVMKLSPGGKVLASAGDDKAIKIWVLKSQWNHFVTKYIQKTDAPPERSGTDDGGYFESVPFREFRGSEGPIVDLAWSKQMYFLLSAGTDKNVRLWHIARQIQICCFPHPDVVPTVVFHPFSDVLFMSGCLDGFVKLWNIQARKVQSHYKLEPRNNGDALITAVNFVTYGKSKVRAFVGTYDGRITVLDVTGNNSLDYHTAFDIRGGRSRSARKITSIEQRPNTTNVLITSNDSRVRLYDVDSWQLTCKYKGHLNVSSQIKASFSHDGKIIISGDEKNFCYFWQTETHYKIFNAASGKGPLRRQLRRDKNDVFHRFRSHESRVTCALFAPEALSDNEGFVKEIFVTSDAKGNIKCFLNIRNP